MDCLVCGKPIPKRAKKYCSLACYHKSPTKGRPPVKPRKPCVVCGKPIKRGERFCSQECFHQYWTGRPNPNRHRRIKKICPQCGKEFEAGGRSGHHKTATFCSSSCQHEAQRKDTGYRAWRRLSQAVTERDGKCMLCGRTDRRLQPHHVVPREYKEWSQFNGEETMDDLISFCAGCHQSVEALTKAGYRNNPDFNPWDLVNMVRVKA